MGYNTSFVRSIAGLVFSLGLANAQLTLTLERPTPPPPPQQGFQSPCVIGESSCSNPPGFPQTDIPSGAGSNDFDLTSPVYTVGLIRVVATTSVFAMGIDINSAGSIADPGMICDPDPMAAETLDLFQVIIDPNGTATVLAHFVGPANLCNGNPGGGFADNRLLPIDLRGFANSDEVAFRAVLSNGGGGKDPFFIIAESLVASTLTVVKQVVPDNGETFQLTIDGPDPADDSQTVGSGGFVPPQLEMENSVPPLS